MSDLEDKTIPIPYNFSDGLTLFKSLRHLPGILREEDFIVKASELFYFTSLIVNQSFVYSVVIYEAFFK